MLRYQAAGFGYAAIGVQGTHGVRGKRSKLLSELADLFLQLVQIGGLG